MKTLKITALCLIMVVTFNQLRAQSEIKTTELNVFKNGTYFVVKEGNINLNKGKCKLELPPAPLLSSFWLTTTKDISISRILYQYDTIRKTKTFQWSIPELLKANTGQRVTITAKFDEKTFSDVSGLLLDFYPTTSFAKLRLDNNSITYIYAGDIKKLTFEKNPVESRLMDSVALLANIEFNKNVDNTKLKMVYMQAGIQWLPSYNIKILDDKELQLEMRALVENFTEKIEDANLTLTVGDPQFKYGRNIEHFISGYLTSLTGTAPQVVYNKYMYQNVSTYETESRVPNSDYNDYTTYTTEGEKTNDLYMYTIGKVSIPKNSKASYQIFSQKIPYKDVYTCNLADIVNYQASSYINLDPEKRYDVFHSLKLTNNTKNPFTTAPVFLQNESLQPLAQDEIKYTAVGGTASVQLSKAIDVLVKNNEEEIKKVEKFKIIGKYNYNKITIRGTVEINNLQDKKITLNLLKSVNAEIIEVSDNGNIRKPGKYSGLNPFTEASWDLVINPNEKKTITYEYEVYVISR